MNKVFIINTHEVYPFSEGRLNRSLVEKARTYLESNGYETQVTTMQDEWETEAEIAKHLWANYVILQIPTNWMGVPWSFKKYQDHVYSFGMDGRLCNGDGRTRKDPSIQYGQGGTLTGKKYMLSITFNAPKESFNDPKQYLFQGKSVDDLHFPTHMNFRFFGMEPLETFVSYDVMKNPQIEADFQRFDEHMKTQFPPLA